MITFVVCILLLFVSLICLIGFAIFLGTLDDEWSDWDE